MARTLETLAPGTPIYCGEQRVGEVRALYGEGTSRAVEWVIAHWAFENREVAIPSSEIESVTERGVVLMHTDPKLYADLTTFNEARFPTARKLS
jgi:hypothetical protein